MTKKKYAKYYQKMEIQTFNCQVKTKNAKNIAIVSTNIPA